jgi:FkbM family methyltransferase
VTQFPPALRAVKIMRVIRNWLTATIKALLPTRTIAAIQQKRLASHIAGFAPQIAEHDYHGVKLRVSIRDSLAAGWYDRDWPEMPELTLLQRSGLRPGANVFDIGAHQGVVAMVAAKLVQPRGTVVAVEGTRFNVAVALENFELNCISNIIAIHAVAAEKTDEAVGFSQTLNGRIQENAPHVWCVTVDSLSKEYGRPNVVLVDVEGYECPVLRGALATLQQPCAFFVEVHAGCGLEEYGSVRELLSFFSPSRFTLYWANGEEQTFEKLQSADLLPAHKFFLIASPKGQLG